MEVSTTGSASFNLFPALAPELRNQIWEEALPEEKIQPSLAFFKPGCWRLHGAAEPDLELIFHHELLAVNGEWPLACVNREARSIALPRIRERGLVARARNRQYPIYARPFEPRVDAMFIKFAHFEDVLVDYETRTSQSDLLQRTVSVISMFRSIAMSEKSLCGEEWVELLHDMLEYSYCSVSELLVVVDAPAALDGDDATEGDKSQWRFVSAPGDVFRWVDCLKRFEMVGEGEHVGDGVVEALLTPEEVVAAFVKRSGWLYGSFTVRPVYAVQG
jgi:hypothetical protein